MEITKQLSLYISSTIPLNLVEIASGFGRHIESFAKELPNVTFLPTEAQTAPLDSIRILAGKNGNILQPEHVVIGQQEAHHLATQLERRFTGGVIDGIIALNLLHISQLNIVTTGLFQLAKALANTRVKTQAKDFPFFVATYGAFLDDESQPPDFASDGDRAFDASLKSRNPEWGLRSLLRDIDPIASQYEFVRVQTIPMNMGNWFVIWEFQG